MWKTIWKVWPSITILIITLCEITVMQLDYVVSEATIASRPQRPNEVLSDAVGPAMIQNHDEDGMRIYTNYKLARIIPQNKRAVEYLRDLFMSEWPPYQLDFWQPPSRVGALVDVTVAPDDARSFFRELDDRNIEYFIISDNLQNLINAERTSSVNYHPSVIQTPAGYHYDRYNPLTTMESQIFQLRNDNPNLITIFDIGKTHENRSIYTVKVSSHATRKHPWRSASSAVWVDGGIHAREWIAPATAMNLLRKLVSGYNTGDPKHRQLLESNDWYITPVLNPDGYEYSHTKNRMWRKNRRPANCKSPVNYNKDSCCAGVDLNRNFDWHFGDTGSSNNPCHEVYHGPAAFSEPESRALRDFLQKVKIHAYITLHSYSQLWLIPFGHKRQTYPKDFATHLRPLSLKATKAMARLYGTKYSVGTAADLLCTDCIRTYKICKIISRSAVTWNVAGITKPKLPSRRLTSSDYETSTIVIGFVVSTTSLAALTRSDEASGASHDYAKGILKVPFSFLVELRPQNGIMSNGFLLPESEIMATGEEIWMAVKVVVEEVISEFGKALPFVDEVNVTAKMPKTTTMLTATTTTTQIPITIETTNILTTTTTRTTTTLAAAMTTVTEIPPPTSSITVRRPIGSGFHRRTFRPRNTTVAVFVPAIRIEDRNVSALVTHPMPNMVTIESAASKMLGSQEVELFFMIGLRAGKQINVTNVTNTEITLQQKGSPPGNVFSTVLSTTTVTDEFSLSTENSNTVTAATSDSQTRKTVVCHDFSHYCKWWKIYELCERPQVQQECTLSCLKECQI